jgi:hypothetical protein
MDCASHGAAAWYELLAIAAVVLMPSAVFAIHLLRAKFKCDHVAGPVVESRYGLTRTQRCIKCGKKAKVEHFDPFRPWSTSPPPPAPLRNRKL